MKDQTKNRIRWTLTGIGTYMIGVAAGIIAIIEFDIAQVPLMLALCFATASAIITFVATCIGKKSDVK